MKPDCIKAVEQAIGRALGVGESQRIEARMVENMRELARTDEKWAGMSQSERLLAAAQRSLEADTAEAAKAAQRKASNLAAQARESANLAERAPELGGKTPHHSALFERLRQLDNYIAGVRSELTGQIVDALKAAEPRFLQLIENPKAVADFVREVYGEKIGNAIAEKGAKAYLDTVEKIRTRENAAGADIGKLDYSYLPQPHDTGAIVKAGKDAWVSKIMPLMDRERFVKEDGAQMNDEELKQFLEHAYDTLSTEGLIRREPGAAGKGSRASRFDDAHRVLHFKDAASYLSYFNDFGKGSVFEAIHNHIGAHAKNIGMMEAFGANPASTYRLLKDTAQIEDSRLAGKPVTGVTKFLATPDMLWETINGDTSTPVNPRAAAIGKGIRNYFSATRLGGIMLSSINDAPMWLATAKYNGVPLGSALRQFMSSLSSGHVVDDAARLGLAVDSIAGEMQTWHAGNMRQDWAGKLANTTMKLQLVESWTHRLRAGLGIMLQDRLAKLKDSAWSDLSAFDRERLKSGGITEKDWQVWQAATPENIRGRDLLTANAIRDVGPSAPKEVAPVFSTESRGGRETKVIDERATEATLPPVQEGKTRLYRAESPTVKAEDVFDFNNEILSKYARPDITGKFYTTSLKSADYYRSTYGRDAKISYVDVPTRSLEGREGQAGEFKVDLSKPEFTDSEINHATAAMLGFIDNEAKTAVLAPDALTRAAITQGAKAGTFGGELGRSVMLFKSFPLAMALRNIDRLRSIPSAQGKVAYSMALLTGLTLFGALSLELKDLVSGKNPRDATTGKFWGAAAAQGGGLGIFGDILYTGLGGNSRGGTPNWTNLGGPVLGGLGDAANVTVGNLGQALQGKDTKAAAELLRFARSNLPFLNLWYLKSAIDHMGFNDLQENVSPGYLGRQRAAARRDWGTTYWWEPNELEPSNFPELASAAGK